MIKTYIPTLLVMLFAGARMTCAQGSMDDILSQLDAAEESGGQQAASVPATSAASASASVDAEPVAKAPAAEDEPALASQTSGSDTLSWLLNKGVEQYKSGNYDEAIALFDGVLAIDKYNKKAVVYRKRASQRIAAKEVKKKTAGRAQALSAVDAAWNPEPKILGVAGLSESTVGMDQDEQVANQVIARLRAVSIPNLDFADAPIEEVARFFVESSRQAGEDVDILLVGMGAATADSNVTISVSEMNLYDALRYVVEMASLKFEIRQNLVVIMPANYSPASAMVARSYDIVPEVGADLESVADSGGGAEDLFGDSGGDESSMEPLDVSDFFSIAEFSDGASAVYQPRFQKLFVKNTPQSHAAIKAVLDDLTEQAVARRSQQVEIETKFVEFSEGALEELGFDWTVYGSGSAASMEMKPADYFQKASGYTMYGLVAPGTPRPDSSGYLDTGTELYFAPESGQQLITDPDGRPGQNLFGVAQRDNTGGFDSASSGFLSLMGGTPSAMVFGNGDVDLRIAAMEQEGTADVLSAPRVTTRSGSEAIIRLAETHRYPQDYDVETGQSTGPVVKPQDWDDFDIGISLKVTPVVDIDTGTIDLELHPQILKFRGFDQYTVGYNRYDAGGNDLVIPILYGDKSPLLSRMASFDRRSVQTQVTVSDGYTVVMGGLVDERTETFRDQVPILGDIPYLGRLFRTEGSRSAKRNLTIFVKASLVDTRGMTSEERKLARQ